MRSRSVITALLASGIVMTGGSAALGVSGLVGSDSASQAQYGPPTPPVGGTLGAGADSPNNVSAGDSEGGGVKGVGGDSGGGVKGVAGDSGGGVKGVAATKDAEGGVRGATSTSPTIQPARQLAATNPGGNQLPFTGFAAIPILLIGLTLLASGVFLRRYGQRSQEQL